ncbi:ABC-type branched-chain amino acid transport systems, periplasmic component [Burkholderia cenocepacia PC184]|nr:ABC-type branched-chain amino acid transport systems, periplasmic component [Burkholderia cenocepacia PC184]
MILSTLLYIKPCRQPCGRPCDGRTKMKASQWSVGIWIALGAVASGAAHADVSVGAVLPLTGASASIGEDQRRGIELAVAQINAKGGVLGQKLAVRI